MNLTRRSFMSWGTLIASGATVGFGALYARRAAAQAMFGPLVADPDSIIDLPAGFSYQILQAEGATMSDGATVRGAPDGMAAFPGTEPGQLILMRNHELDGNGGVSRLVVSTDPVAVVSSNDVLGATTRNCCGGPSPWGWLSCEETTGGGVWLCPTDASAVGARQRIDDYGSFNHEAVCIDPNTLIAYLTEDDGGGFLYRMVPTAVTDPFTGQLQAMIADEASFNTGNLQVGDTVQIHWANVAPASAHDDAGAVGAAIVVRGEGIWWFDGSVFFSATTNGQIFELVPNAANDGGTLTLIADTLDMPDNITVAPWGDIFVAEDNGNLNHIRIVDPTGGVSDFARNAAEPGGEFAGVCFSPDGKLLFVNMQTVGLTLAISGPFPEMDPGSGAGGAGGTTGTGGTDTGGASGSAGSGGSATANGGSAGSATSGGAGNTSGGAPGPGGAPGSGGANASGGVPGSAGAATSADSGDDGGCGCSVPGASSNAQGLLVAAATALGIAARRIDKTDASDDR